MVVLFAALTVAFAGLGAWQLQRRVEKLALITAVDHHAHGPWTAAPPPERWPLVTFKTDGYRAVVIRGHYRHDRETLVQGVSDLGPGFWVITPLRSDAGWTVLINRGFVPAGPTERKIVRPTGEVTVTGLLRLSEPGGGFLHANDPKRNRWYSRDVAAIARARRLGPIAPYFIDASAAPDRGEQPVGGLTVIALPNNHLQYALTWFALAALCAWGAVRAWRSGAGER